MEERVPEPRPPAEIGHENEREEQHAHEFADQHHAQDRVHEDQEVGDRGLVQILPQKDAVRHPDRQSEPGQDQHREGHEAEPAELDQHHDDALPEERKMAAGVDHDQPGYGHGRGGVSQKLQWHPPASAWDYFTEPFAARRRRLAPAKRAMPRDEPVPEPANSERVVERMADWINSGKHIPPSAVSNTLRNELLTRGLVTEAALRRLQVY